MNKVELLAALNNVRDYLSAIAQIDKLTTVHADDRMTIAKKLGADGCQEMDLLIKSVRHVTGPDCVFEKAADFVSETQDEARAAWDAIDDDTKIKLRRLGFGPSHERPKVLPYKESAAISANYTASGPCSDVVLKLTATMSMTTHKLILHETEPGAVVIRNIETDHGGEKKTAHPGLAKIAPFSIVKWHEELHPIHDGPYLGRLDEGESLYFTVDFVKPSKLMVAAMGPQKRT